MLSEFSTDPALKKTDTAAYTEPWKGMTYLEEQIIVAKDFEVERLFSCEEWNKSVFTVSKCANVQSGQNFQYLILMSY